VATVKRLEQALNKNSTLYAYHLVGDGILLSVTATATGTNLEQGPVFSKQDKLELSNSLISELYAISHK
jgi:hypothetical protein